MTLLPPQARMEQIRAPDQKTSITGWLVAIAVALTLAFVWQSRSVSFPETVELPDEPAQTLVERSAFDFKGFRVEPVATFDITALVLSTRRYRLGRESQLSPYDIGVAWGPMADRSMREPLTFRQSGRFLRYRYREALPYPQSAIDHHIANIHAIPPDRSISRDLRRLRPGRVVRLQGYLVNVSAADGWYWRTSLTRTDTGGGACELMWVESVESWRP